MINQSVSFVNNSFIKPNIPTGSESIKQNEEIKTLRQENAKLKQSLDTRWTENDEIKQLKDQISVLKSDKEKLKYRIMKLKKDITQNQTINNSFAT